MRRLSSRCFLDETTTLVMTPNVQLSGRTLCSASAQQVQNEVTRLLRARDDA